MVDNVSEMEGMLALSGVTGPNTSTRAFTIGHYSMGPDGYVADWRDHLFVHEYGHYIQSQRMGPAYLTVVGFPSLFSAALTSKWKGLTHGQRWFEVDASNLGAKYFDKKYGRGKDGYNPFSGDFFEINAFKSEVESKYYNPRDGRKNWDKYQISDSRFNEWDFLL